MSEPGGGPALIPEQAFGAQQAAMQELGAITQEYAWSSTREAAGIALLIAAPWVLASAALAWEHEAWAFLAAAAAPPLAMATLAVLAAYGPPLGAVIPRRPLIMGLARIIYVVGALHLALEVAKHARHHSLPPVAVAVSLALLIAVIALGTKGWAARMPEGLMLGGMLCYQVRTYGEGGDLVMLGLRLGFALFVTASATFLVLWSRVRMRALFIRMGALRAAMLDGGQP